MTEFPPKSIDVEYSPEIAGLRYAALELLINLATLILLVDSPLGGAPACQRRPFSSQGTSGGWPMNFEAV